MTDYRNINGNLHAPRRGKPPAGTPPGYERSDADPYIMVPTVRACKFRVSKQETGTCCPDTFVTWCEHYNKVVIRAECHGCTVPLEWD
jgi:hypothetical protein